MARYTIIAAIDEEGGIGKDGRIPWDCPADRKFFKDTTMGHAIVVGTKTYRTLPALYGRKIYRISRSRQPCTFEVEDILIGFKNQEYEVFIAGGAETYAAFMPHVTRMLITRIPGKHGCDTFFGAACDWNESGWPGTMTERKLSCGLVVEDWTACKN